MPTKAIVPGTVLAAYAEQLLDGRRVIVFGDASSDLGLALVDRGARVVHVYDEDPARAAEAAARNRSRNVSIGPLADSDLAVRDGAFDVAIVENLASAGDRPRLLQRARRALSSRGVAFFAAPNPEVKLALLPGSVARGTEPFGYYDLYDLVSDSFAEVQMLGQAPFAGYAVVDFSNEGDPDVSFDSAFVPRGAEEPEWFIAVGSEHAVELDPFAVIQLPVAAALDGRARTDAEPPRPREAPSVHRAEDSAKARKLKALEAEAITLREQAGAAEDARKRLTKTADEQRAEIEALRSKLATATEAAREARSAAQSQTASAETAEQLRAEIATLREKLGEREARIGEIEARFAEIEARAAAADARADDAREQLDGQKKSVADREAVQRRLVAAEAEAVELRGALAERDARIEQLTAVEDDDKALEDDFAELEAALKDRADRIREIEAAHREALRVGNDLVRELDRARAAPAASESEETARLRADLEAAQWTIDELEGRLEEAARPGDALKKELDRARAELQRQAVLLSQAGAGPRAEDASPR